MQIRQDKSPSDGKDRRQNVGSFEVRYKNCASAEFAEILPTPEGSPDEALGFFILLSESG